VAIAELLNEIPIEPQAALSQEPRYRIRNEEVADEERIVVERDLRNCRNLATKTAWVRIELAENEQERKGPGCRRDRGLPRSAPRPQRKLISEAGRYRTMASKTCRSQPKKNLTAPTLLVAGPSRLLSSFW
jgi:hypothetical protein